MPVYGAAKGWRQWRREGVEVARLPGGTTEAAARPARRAARPAGQNDGQHPGTRLSCGSGPPPGHGGASACAGGIRFHVGGYGTRVRLGGLPHRRGARYRVGGQVSRSARPDFVLEALEQARYARQPFSRSGLIHPSDRGGQYVSIRYTERLAEAGIEPAVGSGGDGYDNALAETIHGLSQAAVSHRQSGKTLEKGEWATLTWVDWFNPRRLLEPIGYMPPAAAEAAYYRQLTESVMAA